MDERNRDFCSMYGQYSRRAGTRQFSRRVLMIHNSFLFFFLIDPFGYIYLDVQTWLFLYEFFVTANER